MDTKSAIARLRNGEQLKMGHYSVGYETFYWSPEESTYMIKREDTGLDYLNPDITYQKLDEAEVDQMLTKVNEEACIWQ